MFCAGGLVSTGPISRYNIYIYIYIHSYDIFGQDACSMTENKNSLKLKNLRVPLNLADRHIPFPPNHKPPEPRKNPLPFHYTGCLIGILIMAYYNPYITG